MTAAGGIHMAVAVALNQLSENKGVHIFLRTEKRLVSVREVAKVLALRVHAEEWVEVIVDDEQEEGIMEQIERLLCMG